MAASHMPTEKGLRLSGMNKSAENRLTTICGEISMLEDLLKRQVPKPVQTKMNGFRMTFYYCPNCNREFRGYGPDIRPKYCDMCGQAVKWNV